MNKARLKKESAVQEIKSKLQNSNAAVLTDYRGLNVAEVTELRRQLREAGVEYKVLKNTLTKIAAQEVGYEGLFEYLEGPTAIAFSTEDPVAPAKILANFAKEHKNLAIKAGLLEGSVVSVDQVKALADLPGREELIAKVLGGLQGPITGLVNVLQGPIRNLTYVLNAIKEEKEA